MYPHRKILEVRLGRKLRRWEKVHHIDGNHGNNDPKNLLAVTTGQHNKLHGSGWMTVGEAIDILERNQLYVPSILYNHRADAMINLRPLL